MRRIFVNLKRFEVPKRHGGLCPEDDPVAWIERVMAETVAHGLALPRTFRTAGVHLTMRDQRPTDATT